MILMDWQRGKIPYFVAPPRENGEEMTKELHQEDMDVEVILDDKNKKYNIDQNIGELLVTNEFNEKNDIAEAK